MRRPIESSRASYRPFLSCSFPLRASNACERVRVCVLERRSGGGSSRTTKEHRIYTKTLQGKKRETKKAEGEAAHPKQQPKCYVRPRICPTKIHASAFSPLSVPSFGKSEQEPQTSRLRHTCANMSDGTLTKLQSAMGLFLQNYECVPSLRIYGKSSRETGRTGHCTCCVSSHDLVVSDLVLR